MSPGGKSLPPDVPPPVHVTLPTPDAEPPPPPSLANGEGKLYILILQICYVFNEYHMPQAPYFYVKD